METYEIVGYSALAAVIILGIITTKKKDIRMPIIEDKVKLLPFWVKSIGFGLAIVSFTGIVIKHAFELSIDVHYPLFFFVLSFLLIALSSEKDEDELFKQLRQNAIYYSFFGMILTLLFFTAIGFILNKESYFISDKYPELKIVFIQLVIYLGKFRSSKKRMKELNALEV